MASKKRVEAALLLVPKGWEVLRNSPQRLKKREISKLGLKAIPYDLNCDPGEIDKWTEKERCVYGLQDLVLILENKGLIPFEKLGEIHYIFFSGFLAQNPNCPTRPFVASLLFSNIEGHPHRVVWRPYDDVENCTFKTFFVE